MNRLMVLCTRHVPHTMAHNAHMAVILVISPNRQRSLVMKMDFGNQTTLRAMVNIQSSIVMAIAI